MTNLNLIGAGLGAAQGFATGGPIGAAVGAAAGGLTGSNGGAGMTSATGNLDTLGLQGLMNWSQNDELANEAVVMQQQSQLQWQSTWFNEMVDERSESQRESNSLRDVSMAQRQSDDKIVKEFMKSINE
ncbi:MAG TPA: hypothetical protein VGZ00_03005 [Candidatus Baltobacteraceae bacterium]|jgi:hypothetical protein|nr:hypothetical protein [Candidatus Baltobacteraceae bacterium]